MRRRLPNSYVRYQPRRMFTIPPGIVETQACYLCLAKMALTLRLLSLLFPTFFCLFLLHLSRNSFRQYRDFSPSLADAFVSP